MGQFFYPEYVPQLVKTSSTQVKLPSGAILNIGANQYKTLSDIYLNLTMSANTLYMVYAVVSGGSVMLVQSTNVNSVGPSGYSAWKLVGAFYSNTAATEILYLVNVEGRPETEFASNPGIIIPAAGFGTCSNQFYSMARLGDSMKLFGQFQMGTVAASASYLTLSNFTLDPAKISVNDRNLIGHGKPLYGTLGGDYRIIQIIARQSTLDRVWTSWQTTLNIWDTHNISTIFSTSQGFSFEMSANIQGWSNTPLRYL